MSDYIKIPPIADNNNLKYNDFLQSQQAASEIGDAFWAAMAREKIEWIKPFSIIRKGDFSPPVQVEWFPDGQLNVSANCLDRHLLHHADKTAIIWVGDAEGEERRYTYGQLAAEVNRWANMLLAEGVKKGDPVIIYLPMIPEAAMVMLACARIGAIHSTVFGGFSSGAVRDRIQDCGAKIVITADEGMRGGKTVPLKTTIDEAVADAPSVRRVLVVKRTGNDVAFDESRDRYVDTLLPSMSDVCAPAVMDAEDPLFILYTSGSTGSPKGLVHTQAGYLLYASMTFSTYFDYQPDDVFFCTADIGWITGHSYIVYGPLANAATVLMFEGVPTYPEADRYWKIIDQYKVSIFYTAPTALRSLMRMGDQWLETSSRDSLRILASVGEPINPEAWLWYFNKVGKQKRPVVDTWWQTETGGHMIAPTPAAPEMKPGWAMMPFFGIEPVLLDAENNEITGAGEGALFIRHPWPGLARTIYKNHDRFISAYFSHGDLYCTGDGAVRDADGYYQITGRVDDVINVSGHRFGTAEIESALVAHPVVAEAAVIGREHAVKGAGIYAYVTLNDGVDESDALKKELNNHVRKTIGAIASLDWIQFASGLPKTRSGKIMRRILRKIAANEIDQLGDTSTLADPQVVDDLVQNRVD